MIIDVETREMLLEISSVIEQAIRAEDPTLYFAVFLLIGNEIVYLANGERKEIRRLLSEWLKYHHRNGEFGFGLIRNETSEDTDVRLAVERKCAEVGEKLSRKMDIALFLFKNDEDCPSGVGVNAFFYTLPNAREHIATWLKRQDAGQQS